MKTLKPGVVSRLVSRNPVRKQNDRAENRRCACRALPRARTYDADSQPPGWVRVGRHPTGRGIDLL